MKQKTSALQAALEQAHVTLKEHQGELEEHRGQVQRLQEELIVEGRQVRALEEVLGDLRAESREHEKTVLALQQRCAEQAQEHEAEARTLQDSWLQAQATLAEQEQELEALRAENQYSRQQEEAAFGQAEALQEALSRAQAALQEKEQRLLEQAELSCTLEASTATLQATLDTCQARARQLEEALRGREGEIQAQALQHQEVMQHLQQELCQKEEELRQQDEQRQLLEKAVAQRSQDNGIQEKEEETRGLLESLKELQLTVAQKEEEILMLREAQQRQNQETSSPSHRSFPAEKPSLQLLLAQQDLERLQNALRQTEAREIEWREKAQGLALSLAQSKASISSLQEIAMFLQASVLERESEQQRLQEELVLSRQALEEQQSRGPHSSSRADQGPKAGQGTEPGEVIGAEPSPGVGEKEQLRQRLERLQQAVAELEVDRSKLQCHNAQLRTTLEQVERERRKLKRDSLRASRAGSLEARETMNSSPTQQDGRGSQRGSSDSMLTVELQREVALLRAQLALERKQRQDYIARSVQTSRELAGLHHSLSHSLLTVAQAPEATVLEAETKKLDESLNQSLTSPAPFLHPSLDTTQNTHR